MTAFKTHCLTNAFQAEQTDDVEIVKQSIPIWVQNAKTSQKGQNRHEDFADITDT